MNNRIEILAPAGGIDSVIAAVRSGADAVYIGAKKHSARASAHNFDNDEIHSAVRYCHQRGVKVYLALNTIIFDDEMKEALEQVKEAARADIDAVIVQDPGLASLIQKAVPDLALHASTQMSVHTPYGALAMQKMGYRRVVLARELSLDEIREIHDFVPGLELEVFVHGALCMCMSGQCYLSAMIGGRSANRGMCAQPCRLPMRYRDNDHALSLKDNGSLGYIRALEKIGVSSAKIEGRMKRPEYVAAATAAAKEARENGRVSEKTNERLRSVFSRTGFTDGYMSGKTGSEMFGTRRRDDVVSADPHLLKEIRASYKDEVRAVPIEMTLSVRTGERMKLTVTDGSHRAEVKSAEAAQQAENLPLTRERAAQYLSKTGGTPYDVTHIDADIEGHAAVSAAALNALRRKALTQLDDLRAKRHDYQINDFDLNDGLSGGAAATGEWMCVNTLDIPKAMKNAAHVFVSLAALAQAGSKEIERKISEGYRIGAQMPRATFGNEKEVAAALEELKDSGITDILAHNIASVYLAKELGLRVHGGFGLNLANSYALQWAARYGIEDAEISPELDIKRIDKLVKPIPVGIIRYGYLPLMISRNAPSGVEKSCKNNGYLQDRMNEKFYVRNQTNYSEIYNSVPILMPQKDYNGADGVFDIIRFSVENSVENMEKILENLRENRDFERFTHGLYLRGVKNFTIF